MPLSVAPIIPDPGKIKNFRTEAAFNKWMRANHARETELWLRIYKKDSGVPTITSAQALDVALCWGWSATKDTVPDDLRAAIEASPRARKTFRTLGRQNLFALAFRTNNMKTPAGRAKKIAALVAMLERGETIIPQRQRCRDR